MGSHFPFFVLYINLVYVLNFEPECPKCHILISFKCKFLCDKHIFCKSLLPRASFSLLSHRQCFSAHLITRCVTSFLILSYVYISCLNHIFLSYYFLLASVQSLSHRQCLLSHPTHHHKCHLSTADTPTTQQNNTSYGQSTSPTFCPPAAPLLPATSLTSHSLLAACCPTLLVLAIAAQHLVSDPASINTLPTVRTKLNKVSILCFDWSNTILAAPRQQLSEMANGMAMVMVDGNGNCNGQW
jgi:hypothetical protein